MLPCQNGLTAAQKSSKKLVQQVTPHIRGSCSGRNRRSRFAFSHLFVAYQSTARCWRSKGKIFHLLTHLQEVMRATRANWYMKDNVCPASSSIKGELVPSVCAEEADLEKTTWEVQGCFFFSSQFLLSRHIWIMNSKVYPRVQNNYSPCEAATPFCTGGESAFIRDTH